MESLNIAIGTKSPSKAKGIEQGFRDAFADVSLNFILADVASGIADQPFGFEETLAGVWNRITHARVAHRDADYYAANESGLIQMGNDLRIINWVGIENQAGRRHANWSTSFCIPPAVAHRVLQGQELGPALVSFFGPEADKKGLGGSGHMTDQQTERAKLIRDTVITTLIPFKHPEWWGWPP